MKWVFETRSEQKLLPSVYPMQSPGSQLRAEESDPDERDLMERVNYDEDLLQDIVMMFECDAPSKLSELEKALVTHDSLALERAAHAMRGILLNFSAREAAESASVIEKLGRTKSWANASETLTTLHQQVDALDQRLNELLHRRAS
jgi:HPt (histidine-containing phosphotransfer) domain-containing protein